MNSSSASQEDVRNVPAKSKHVDDPGVDQAYFCKDLRESIPYKWKDRFSKNRRCRWSWNGLSMLLQTSSNSFFIEDVRTVAAKIKDSVGPGVGQVRVCKLI